MVHHRTLATGLLVLSLPLAAQATQPSVVADAAKEARERSLAKMRQTLDQKPTHAQVFDHYVKLLVEGNTLESEIEALAKKLEATPGETTTSIVLGRLYLRTGREDKALEVLDAIAAKTPEIQGVLGEIYQKLARFDQAARAYEAALPAAVTSEAKSKLYEKIGKSQLSLGQKPLALATWSKIGELDGGKLYRRLQVADLLAEAGLLAEAEKAYEPLLAETADDPAQQCRVLRDQGRLQELAGNLDKALATYEEVLKKTARGNWLRKIVEGRVVQIYRRTGKLDALVARLEATRKEQPDDPAPIELLADVYLETKKPELATQALADATRKFPSDVRFGRRLAQLLVDRGELDKAIAEYQRILTAKPDELELYLELGQLFAKGEKFKEAKNQWEKVLARNLKDAGLCTRIASMYALYEREEDAVRLYERAIEIEPEDMARYSDLAEYLFSRGKAEPAKAVLERAFVAAAGKPRRLEAIVGILREHEMVAKAKACLEGILAAEPGNQETRYALADLLLQQKDAAGAKALLWQVLEAEDKAGQGQRTQAANMLVQLAIAENRREGLEAEAGARPSAGAAFLLGRLHSRNREFDKAIASYRKAVDRRPDDVEARRLLARLLSDEGDYRGALAEYAKAEQIAPGESKRQFREVARLHLETYELDKATLVWQKAMRDNPDNASVFVEVGKEFLAIQRVPEALDAFLHAARLKASDPDIQLRLADAMRQAGKPEDAERQLLEVATKALDSRDKEQARSKLYELYAEQGLIDKRIESMASTVSENPYDQDAPQLLADLYMRTGDYVLGLEMVERSVTFQPRNKELLTRRAELLEALEEWDKSRVAHEELLKFPDAERDVHLAGIGQALYESGRASEAKAVFEKIQDRGRVAALYKKYELREEAIEYYKRAIGKAPADLRNYVDLAEQLVERNRQDEAIAILERGLNLNASHRRSLELLGKLYVQKDRREDAVRCGMRLFGLRGEETEKTRREEYEAEKSGNVDWWAHQPFGQQRLQAAQSYFEERGLKEEWGKILVAEAKRRPSNTDLFEAVTQHFSWRDKSAQKLAAFLRELLQEDLLQARIPPGFTARSYRERMETALVQVWQEDAAVAEKRIAELAAATSAAELVERAKLRQCTGRLEDMEKDLGAALAAEASHPIAHALLVDLLVEQKRYAEAIPHVDALLAWWDRAGDVRKEVEERKLVLFRQERKQMLDELPRRVRRKATDAQLAGVLDRTRSSEYAPLHSFSFPESVPQPFALHGKKIRLCRAAGDRQGLATTVAKALAAATTIAERQALGELMFQEQQRPEAERLLRSVLEEGERLQRDPEQIFFWPRYQGVVAQAALSLGEIEKQRGRAVDAYLLLRRYGHRDKAEGILAASDIGGDVERTLEAAAGDAKARLEKARAEGHKDLETIELDYRDEVIKLADFRIGQKRFDDAEKLYQDSLALLPDDIEIREVLAKMRKRRTAFAEAIKTHEEIIETKRRKKRALAGETAMPPTRLHPSAPDEGEDGMEGGSYLYHGGGGGMVWSPGGWRGGYYGYGRGSGDRFAVASNYLAILGIHTERHDQQGVLDALRKVMQEDPATFREMSWEVLESLKNQDLGKKKLPILRILKSAVQGNDWLTLEYARACIEENELQEARRTLEKFLAKQTGGGHEEAEKELEKVAQKLGESKTTVADLQKAVAAEPDNVRHRLRLAERLKKEHDYAAMLEQAQAIVAKAPYLSRAKEMVVEAAAACGKDDVAMAMMRKLFDETSETNDKLRRGVNLANWLFAEGKTKESFAIVEKLETSSGGAGDFSPGTWFLDKHELAHALASYGKEIEKAKSQQWELGRLRPRVVRLEMASGKAEAGIARCLEALDEAGSLGDREQRWKELLGACKNHPDPARLAKELEPHAQRKTVQDRLVMAALGFARGDVAAAAADLEQAVLASAKEVYLFPLLLGLERLEGDGEGALAVLERMSKVYGGSGSVNWSDGVSLSERDRLKLERSKILEEMGKVEEASKTIESLLDETQPATLQTIAQIWRQKKKFEKALEWHRRYVQKLGRQERADLGTEAELLLELGRVEEALPLVREAYKMARGEDGTRDMLIRVYKRLRRLPELVKELEAELAKDQRNQNVRSALLGLYEKLHRPDDSKRIYESMKAQEDLRESGIRGLIELARKRNDLDDMAALQLELVALKGGEEKKEAWRTIAETRAEQKRWAEAEEAYKKALDLGTAEGWSTLGEWLSGKEQHGMALAAWSKVLELDREREQAFYPFAKECWRNKDFKEAFARGVEWLRKDRAKTEWWGQEQHTLLLDSLVALPESDRAVLLAGAADAKALETAALCSLLLCDFAAAERKAAAALAAAPGALVALDVRRLALRHLGRVAELIDATEAMRLGIERAYMASADWTYSERARQLQDSLGRMAHELGDDQRAEKLWGQAPLRRTPYGDPFGYWRNDWSVRYVSRHWLAVRRPEKALAAYQTEFLQYESPPWNEYMQALEESGRFEDVVEFAWKRLLDPLELYGVVSGYSGYYWDEDGTRQQTTGAGGALVRLYRRQGKLDELTAKATQMLAAPGTRRQAASLLDMIARTTNDQRLLRDRAERKVREEPLDRNLRHAAALANARAGDAKKGLEHLACVLDFSCDLLDELAPDSRRGEHRYYHGGYQGPDNPFSFSFSDERSYGWWGGGWEQELDNYRRTAAALLWASGDTARARRVEQSLLEFTTQSTRENDLQQLARIYDPIVPGEAARLRSVLLEDQKEAGKRADLLATIARNLRKAGDRDREKEALHRCRTEREKQLAELPGPHAFALRKQIATFLLDDLGDAAAAREHAELVLRSLPLDRDAQVVRAFCLLRLAQGKEAVAAFRALSEQRRLRGEKDSPREEAGLGLALVAVGDRAAGKALLQGAVTALGETTLADEVKKALEALR